MYKLCTTEKTAAQQAAFEQCLLEAMGRRPYAEITVSSLCERTGLSRKIFYRLFGSKEDLLFALVDHTIVNYAHFDYADAEDVPGAPATLQRFLAYWRAQKPLLDALDKNQMSSVLLDRSLLHITREDIATMRLFGADDHPYSTEVILFYFSSIICLVVYWHHKGYNHSIPEMAALITQLLTQPPVHLADGGPRG